MVLKLHRFVMFLKYFEREKTYYGVQLIIMVDS